MLYPRESESREVKDLCGVWIFKVDRNGAGRKQRWFARPLTGAIPMPVPSSYNDITQDAAIRDHIGDVWYEREFFVPADWRGRRVVLRIESATHHAVVWVNGREVASHKGGYLPFEAEITDVAAHGAPNRLTIVVNNVLDGTTLPPGRVKTVKNPWGSVRTQEYWYDFLNYAGLHRAVRLYTTPAAFISDIGVVTGIRGRDGIVNYQVRLNAMRRTKTRLLDANGREVAGANGVKGRLVVRKAKFWAPGAPYLYTLEVATFDENGIREDVYRLPVGIRTVEVRGTRFLINGRPLYFKGCCKHEDSDLRGKGYDAVTDIKDFNLLKWIGANSVRTSHYPYSDEFMQLADREGIAVIDESPAVGCNMWGEGTFFVNSPERRALLKHHLDVMRELVDRDRNHPCVVMWSVANEPASQEPGAGPYFRKVVSATRRLDPTRPVTMVSCAPWDKEQTGSYLDVVCVNRYYGWYTNTGRLETIESALEWDLKQWFKRFRKPVLLSEFGADTIEGMHKEPPMIFSEEFQCEFLRRYHAVLDRCGFVIGEHVWNFADFMTKQGIFRVGGNRKGVFTRQRQPKMAAHVLRQRWKRLTS